MRVLLKLIILDMLFLSAAMGAELAALEAKGLKFKKAKDGAVIEVYVGANATMAPAEYQAIGEFRDTLMRVNLSPDKPRLNGEILAAIGPLPKVEQFFGNGAELLDEDFRHFSGWTSLKNFGLDHWGWFKTPNNQNVGPGLAHLAALPHLEELRLGGCRVGDPAIEAVSKISTLKALDIFHLGYTDEGVAALRSLKKLTKLRINGGRLTNESLEYVSGIESLEMLTISEMKVDYAGGFEHLKKLRNLKKIELERVKTGDDDVSKLKADHPAAEVTWTKPADRPESR
ncbi:MAG: hypothetical protein ABSF26_18440 [Thermoguttaceae bacterium]|jgi:hypothetical protein